MGLNIIDAQMLSKMFLAGAKNLEHKKEWINELNVFPVPDGDTGTNMSMTIMSAAKEVAAISEPSMASLAKAISSGSLRGARGNSGVILSQLFRGFSKVISEYDEIISYFRRINDIVVRRGRNERIAEDDKWLGKYAVTEIALYAAARIYGISREDVL